MDSLFLRSDLETGTFHHVRTYSVARKDNNHHHGTLLAHFPSYGARIYIACPGNSFLLTRSDKSELDYFHYFDNFDPNCCCCDHFQDFYNCYYSVFVHFDCDEFSCDYSNELGLQQPFYKHYILLVLGLCAGHLDVSIIVLLFLL